MHESKTNRKEYARLSMAIKKAKEKGQEYTALLILRNKLLSGRTKQSILSSNLSDKHDKLINDKKVVNNYQITHLLAEQIKLNNELLNQVISLLKSDKNKQENKKELIEQNFVTEGRNIDSKELKADKLSASTSHSPTKKTTLRVASALLTKIKAKHANFSAFLRQALLAYQARSLVLSEDRHYQAKKELVKLSVRLDKEQKNIYQSFAQNKKTELLNQILAGAYDSF